MSQEILKIKRKINDDSFVIQDFRSSRTNSFKSKLDMSVITLSLFCRFRDSKKTRESRKFKMDGRW